MANSQITSRMKRRETRKANKRMLRDANHKVFGETRPQQSVALFDWFSVFRFLFR